MKIDKRFLLLLAVGASAAVGAVTAAKAMRHRRTAHDLQHKNDLKSWENEGGNLAPATVSPAQT